MSAELVRPRIPLSLKSLLACMLSACLIMSKNLPFPVFCGLVCIVALSVVICFRLRRIASQSWSMLAYLLGILLAAFLFYPLQAQLEKESSAIVQEPAQKFRFVALGDMNALHGRYSGIVELLDTQYAGARLYVYSSEKLIFGREYTVKASIKALQDSDFDRRLRSQSVLAHVQIESILASSDSTNPLFLFAPMRNHIVELCHSYKSPAAGFLAALLCGSQEQLKADKSIELVRRVGLSHMVAISGAHIALICMMIEKLSDYASLSLRKKVFLSVCGSAAFVLLCGMPLSALRAWLMSISTLGAQLCGRKAQALHSLAVVAFVMLLLDPRIVTQIGFVLSLVSIAGICIFGSWLSCWLTYLFSFPHSWTIRFAIWFKSAFKGLCTSCAVCLAAQLTTLPLVAIVFKEVSLLSLLSNLLIGPLYPLVMLIGGLWLLINFFAAELGQMLACVALWPPELMYGLINLLAAIPHAVIAISKPWLLSCCVVVLLALVYCLWPLPSNARYY